jgi:addiction module RelE/StbE family toxin
MPYTIECLESVFKEDIPKISPPARKRIKKAIEERLATNPIEYGKPLRYSLKGCRRLRMGDWRIIYKVEENNLVLVVKIGHRKEVYEE